MIDPDVVDLHGEVVSFAVPSRLPDSSSVIELVHGVSVTITVTPRLLCSWITIAIDAAVRNEAIRSSSSDVQDEVKLLTYILDVINSSQLLKVEFN